MKARIRRITIKRELDASQWETMEIDIVSSSAANMQKRKGGIQTTKMIILVGF